MKPTVESGEGAIFCIAYCILSFQEVSYVSNCNQDCGFSLS